MCIFGAEIFGRPLNKIRGHLLQDLCSGNPLRDGRSNLEGRDGRTRQVSVTSAEIRDGSGCQRGQVFVIRDTSAEDGLLQEAVRAQQLEALGELAGGIAHDFNNLLLAIEGNLSIAREDAPDHAELRHSLDAAQTACHRARELPQLLLTMSKGGAPVLTQDCRLDELLRECLELSMPGTSIEVDLQIPDDLPLVDVDRRQMSLAINQLLRNARQAMPNGGTLHLNAKVVNQDAPGPDSFVELQIRDEGAGIDSEARARIFDPYFTTRHQGRGLGLTIAHRVLTRHGGSLELSPESGLGACFRLRLPSRQRPDHALRPTPLAHRTRIPRILVLDDEQPIRLMLSRMLKRLHCEPILAETGRQALGLARDAHENGQGYDLAILDLSLPGGIGGLETLRQLRAMGIQVPAIVMTGYSADAAVADPTSFGFVDALQKPFQLSEIRALLGRLLSSLDSPSQPPGEQREQSG